MSTQSEVHRLVLNLFGHCFIFVLHHTEYFHQQQNTLVKLGFTDSKDITGRKIGFLPKTNKYILGKTRRLSLLINR